MDTLNQQDGAVDFEALWHQCRASLTKRYIFDEDLVSEMLTYALEQAERHPGQTLSLKILYLRAVDKLNPRIQTGDTRVRQSSFVTAWEEIERAPAPQAGRGFQLDDIPCRLPPSGPLRAMILLRIVYHYTQAEIAILFGCTESRVSQLMHQSWLPKYLDDDIGDLLFDDLQIPVQWAEL